MIEYVYHPAEDFPSAMEQLHRIIGLLRSPEGCPWDRELTAPRTAQSIIDETYEYIDELKNHRISGQREEIGDILINVVTLLHMHEDNASFPATDAINEVCEKLIRRHPHVFTDTVSAHDSTEVLSVWNNVKEEIEGKKAEKENPFSRIPKSLPPLERAYEIQKKMKKVGFEWPDVQGVLNKVCEELDELVDATNTLEPNQERIEEEAGDLLFAVVNLVRFLGFNPAQTLHGANQKLAGRFEAVARLAVERNIPLDKEHMSEMDELWEEVKVSSSHHHPS
ncbi:nucleoside triphosphate pyrophosphohydrolase [Parasphaerochaeta coccoides]|uniref:MazG family protein n=1 Tax=Parasphaerochaeta coccoides (strain ATCC BAA-1237 / DSM 17374 / SPN1) TaxID=760011 RepID=F4GK72_PARC1|nr:nucleoside triphosphate pyrophosphohydrolase [Parasphaerochaeta coccoides]AEC01844.1 MazG family protein [Parasphaerochaeta coccoides DSM 17374]